MALAALQVALPWVHFPVVGAVAHHAQLLALLLVQQQVQQRV